MMNQLSAVQRFKIVFFTIAGVCLLLVGAVVAFYEQSFINRAAVAPGVVVRQNAGGSHVTVGFTTATGETIEYPQNGLIFGYQAGDRVEVLRDAENPRSAAINTFGALRGTTLFLFALGGGFVGIAQLARVRPDLVE